MIFCEGNITCTSIFHYCTTACKHFKSVHSARLCRRGKVFGHLSQRNVLLPAALESQSRLCAHKHWPQWTLVPGFAKVLLVHHGATADEKGSVEITILLLELVRKHTHASNFRPMLTFSQTSKLPKGNPVAILAIVTIN